MMEVKLGQRFKHLQHVIKNKLERVNFYYLIWIVIHFVYYDVRKFHQYFIEYIWNHVVVKYFVALIYNYYYNSRIYYNFYHYCYHYYYASSKKNEDHSPCQNEDEDVVINRKNLVNLEDYLEQQDIINVIGTTGTLTKYPKHIAFSILNFREDLLSAASYNDNNNKQAKAEKVERTADNHKVPVGEKELRAICKLISWSWMAQARVVSLYDYDGIMEGIPSRVESCLRQEIEKTIHILKKCQPRLLNYYQCLPKIKIHEIGQENCEDRNLSGSEIPSQLSSPEVSASTNALDVCVFSKKHGKATILKTVSKLSKRPSLPSLTSRRLPSYSEDASEAEYDPHGHHRRSELKESKVNDILSQSLYTNVAGNKALASTNTGSITEPDLLLVVGNLKSTMGFLPWNLRLTEIHWIPIPDLVRLDSQDFITVLQKYSRAQQRFGT